MSANAGTLPFIDRHCVEIRASRAETWVALGEVLSGVFGGIGSVGFARVLGTRYSTASALIYAFAR